MDHYPSYLTIKCSNLHIVIHSTVSINYDVHSLHLTRTLCTHNNGPVLIIPYHQRVPINKVITHSTVSIDYDVHSLLLSRTLKTYNNGPQFIIRYDRHQVFQSTKLSISPCLQVLLSRALYTYNNGPLLIIPYHHVFQFKTKSSYIPPCLQTMTCIIKETVHIQ